MHGGWAMCGGKPWSFNLLSERRPYHCGLRVGQYAFTPISKSPFASSYG